MILKKIQGFLELKIPPLLLAILFAFVSWITTINNLSNMFRLILIPFFTIVGLTVILAGIVSFRRAKTTVNPNHPEKVTQLVKSGIFRYTRNPMYLGFFMILAGWSIYLNSIVAIALDLLFLVYMNVFQIKPEERVLRKIFGVAYNEYCKRVPRWI